MYATLVELKNLKKLPQKPSSFFTQRLTVLGIERIELAKIAGYMHDIGNCVNRVDHAHTGAVLAYNILKEMGMSASDRTEIMMAIGNHDEKSGTAVSDISAALILADKSDAHRTRVSKKDLSEFDKRGVS